MIYVLWMLSVMLGRNLESRRKTCIHRLILLYFMLEKSFTHFCCYLSFQFEKKQGCYKKEPWVTSPTAELAIDLDMLETRLLHLPDVDSMKTAADGGHGPVRGHVKETSTVEGGTRNGRKKFTVRPWFQVDFRHLRTKGNFFCVLR